MRSIIALLLCGCGSVSSYQLINDDEASAESTEVSEGFTEEAETEIFRSSCGDRILDPEEDCDGDLPRTCITTCGSTGYRFCTECHWTTECVSLEVCNAIDDDCDGSTIRGTENDEKNE